MKKKTKYILIGILSIMVLSNLLGNALADIELRYFQDLTTYETINDDFSIIEQASNDSGIYELNDDKQIFGQSANPLMSIESSDEFNYLIYQNSIDLTDKQLDFTTNLYQSAYHTFDYENNKYEKKYYPNGYGGFVWITENYIDDDLDGHGGYLEQHFANGLNSKWNADLSEDWSTSNTIVYYNETFPDNSSLNDWSFNFGYIIDASNGYMNLTGIQDSEAYNDNIEIPKIEGLDITFNFKYYQTQEVQEILWILFSNDTHSFGFIMAYNYFYDLDLNPLQIASNGTNYNMEMKIYFNQLKYNLHISGWEYNDLNMKLRNSFGASEGVDIVLGNYGGNNLIDSTFDNFLISNTIYDSGTYLAYHNTFEYWYRSEVADTTIQLALQMDNSSLTEDIDIRQVNTAFQVNDVTVFTMVSDVWYHIKIDFECTTEGHYGLPQYHFNLWIDNEYIGQYAFKNNVNYIRYFYCYGQYKVSPTDIKYFDALGCDIYDDYERNDNMYAYNMSYSYGREYDAINSECYHHTSYLEIEFYDSDDSLLDTLYIEQYFRLLKHNYYFPSYSSYSRVYYGIDLFENNEQIEFEYMYSTNQFTGFTFENLSINTNIHVYTGINESLNRNLNFKVDITIDNQTFSYLYYTLVNEMNVYYMKMIEFGMLRNKQKDNSDSDLTNGYRQNFIKYMRIIGCVDLEKNFETYENISSLYDIVYLVPDTPDFDEPSKEYWLYQSCIIVFSENVEIKAENITFDFPLIEIELISAKFYVNHIKGIGGNWGINDWLRQLLNLAIRYLISYPIQFMLYFLTIAFNYIIMFLIVGSILVLFWNIIIYYLMVAFIWLIWLVITITPFIISGLLIGISSVISAILWFLSGGVIDYVVIYDVVESIVEQVFIFIYEILIIFIEYLPIFLIYISSYLIIVGLYFISLIIVKARGYKNREASVEASYSALVKPIQLVVNGVKKIWNIIKG